jgi:Porin PorA
MRRTVGLVLLALGVAFLVLAPLLRFYALPNLAKAPLDQKSQTVSVAENATYLDIGALQQRTGATLTATRRVHGDVAAGSDDIAVYDVFVRVENAEGTLVTGTLDRVAFDRRTSLARHCCGEALNGAPTPHEGIEYKFPFGVEKKTYQYFDTTLAKASDMTYKSSEKIAGLNTYKFEQRIEPTQIAELEVPGNLIGRTEATVPVQRFYSNTRTVWVEPKTGAIVKGQEQQFSTLRDDSGTDKLTVTEANLVFNDETIKEQAKTAKEGARSITLLGTLGPILLVILGIVLAGLGLAMALASRQEQGDPSLPNPRTGRDQSEARV